MSVFEARAVKFIFGQLTPTEAISKDHWGSCWVKVERIWVFPSEHTSSPAELKGRFVDATLISVKLFVSF